MELCKLYTCLLVFLGVLALSFGKLTKEEKDREFRKLRDKRQDEWENTPAERNLTGVHYTIYGLYLAAALSDYEDDVKVFFDDAAKEAQKQRNGGVSVSGPRAAKAPAKFNVLDTASNMDEAQERLIKAFGRDALGIPDANQPPPSDDESDKAVGVSGFGGMGVRVGSPGTSGSDREEATETTTAATSPTTSTTTTSTTTEAAAGDSGEEGGASGTGSSGSGIKIPGFEFEGWGTGKKRRRRRRQLGGGGGNIIQIAELAAEAARRDGRELDVRVRKEYRCLTFEEREKFHKALNALKDTPTETGLSAYDVFAVLHHSQFAPAAHFNPSWLGWHRILLIMFEEALRQMEPGVVLPYWDSSADGDMSDPLDSRMWRDDYMGTARGPVTTGAAADWQTPLTGLSALRRNVSGETDLLYDEEIIETLMDLKPYSNMWEFADLVHGAVHMYVGGNMLQLLHSPFDPIFFMHHAFVDCLWEEWREKNEYPYDIDPRTQYPPNKGLPIPHRKNSRMLPFVARNVDGMSRALTTVYYKCHPRNSCPNSKCGYDRYSRDCDEGLGGAIASFVSLLPEWLQNIWG